MKLKKYQIALTLIFLGMTITGAIGLNTAPIGIVRETHETTTSDGVLISFNIYYKSTVPANRPVIVMGHGVIVNKEMMTNYAMELAARDFVVASLDWRGHGQSGGTLDTNKLVLDLEAVIGSIHAIVPSANMSNLGLIGYSMGGWPTFLYAATHPEVKAWIGVGTRPNGTISNMTNPRNALVVIGTLDEGFSRSGLQAQFVNMTGVASANNVQLGHLYGSLANGTARQIDEIPAADHVMVPWDVRFISAATDWMVRTFDGVVPDQSFMVYHERLILLIVGLVGLVGLIYGVSVILAKALKIANDGEEDANHESAISENQNSISGKKLILLYYAWSLLLLPTAIVPAMTFFLPLFVTSFLITLIGCLSINLCIFSWRYLKKQGISFKNIVKLNVTSGKTWILSITIAVVFLAGFYYIVGLNYLAEIPPVTRLAYVPIYGIILFLSYLCYTIFIDKILDPLLERRIGVKNEKLRYITKSLATFALMFSWFVIIIMIICAATKSLFTVMILVFMVPIFIFGSFGGVYLQRLTRSSLPNVLLQSVFLSFLIVTLSPMGSILGLIMQHF